MCSYVQRSVQCLLRLLAQFVMLRYTFARSSTSWCTSVASSVQCQCCHWCCRMSDILRDTQCTYKMFDIYIVRYYVEVASCCMCITNEELRLQYCMLYCAVSVYAAVLVLHSTAVWFAREARGLWYTIACEIYSINCYIWCTVAFLLTIALFILSTIRGFQRAVFLAPQRAQNSSSWCFALEQRVQCNR
jgi:hypothetical protein